MTVLQAPIEMCLLRSRLNKITHEDNLSIHAERIDALREEIAHSISVLPEPNLRRTYNCVMHALGLESDDFEIPALAASQAKPRFIDFLICRGHLLSQPRGVNGLLVVYSTNGKAQHIGRVVDNSRVESKWGTGHLYEHELWEVPSDFGNNASFFPPVDHDTLINCFCEWQKSEER